MSALSTFCSYFSRASEVLDALLPFSLWFLGALMVVDALTGWDRLTALASHPEAFVFAAGVFIWLAGSASRDFQKEASRLRRDLERCERQRDMYEEMYREERDDGYFSHGPR